MHYQSPKYILKRQVHTKFTGLIRNYTKFQQKAGDIYAEICYTNKLRAEQSRAEQSRAEQSRAEQSRAEQLMLKISASDKLSV